MLQVVDGLGNTAAWDYAPLAGAAKHPEDVPLCDVPDALANRYIDDGELGHPSFDDPQMKSAGRHARAGHL